VITIARVNNQSLSINPQAKTGVIFFTIPDTNTTPHTLALGQMMSAGICFGLVLPCSLGLQQRVKKEVMFFFFNTHGVSAFHTTVGAATTG
jgi:hypothetical protein